MNFTSCISSKPGSDLYFVILILRRRHYVRSPRTASRAQDFPGPDFAWQQAMHDPVEISHGCSSRFLGQKNMILLLVILPSAAAVSLPPARNRFSMHREWDSRITRRITMVLALSRPREKRSTGSREKDDKIKELTACKPLPVPFSYLFRTDSSKGSSPSSYLAGLVHPL